MVLPLTLRKNYHSSRHVTWQRRLPLAARLTFLGVRDCSGSEAASAAAGKVLTNKQITILPVRISGQAKHLINSASRCYPPPRTWPRRAPRHTTSREQAWILPLPGVSRFRCFCYYLNLPYVLHGPLRHPPLPGVSHFRQISYYLSNLVCVPVCGTSGEAGDGGQRGPVAAANQSTARPVGPWMEYRRPPELSGGRNREQRSSDQEQFITLYPKCQVAAVANHFCHCHQPFMSTSPKILQMIYVRISSEYTVSRLLVIGRRLTFYHRNGRCF